MLSLIRCYTGTPGSGKSLHVIQKVCAFLAAGKNVIANFPLKMGDLKKKHKGGRFFYVPNEKITVDFLYQFMNLYHEENVENQTLVCIDEASVKFNCRDYGAKDRAAFNTFFAQHRKFGYTVVLVQQNLRQIDRQIRDLVELEVKHRKLNNFSFFRFLPFNLFIAVEKNVELRHANEHEYFLYNKYYGSLYDTFYDFTRTERFEDREELIQFVQASELLPCLASPRTACGEGVPEAGPHPQPARAEAEACKALYLEKGELYEEIDGL